MLLHIKSSDKITAEAARNPFIGWGENGYEALINTTKDEIYINVERDDKSQFGIQINNNGQLIITDYSMCFQQAMPHQVVFEPCRPWKAYEKESK